MYIYLLKLAIIFLTFPTLAFVAKLLLVETLYCRYVCIY